MNSMERKVVKEQKANTNIYSNSKTGNSFRFRMYGWHIIYPLCIYHIILIGTIFSAELLIGNGVEDYMKCQILGTLAALPVIYLRFYKENLVVIGAGEERPKQENIEKVKSAILVILGAACIGVGFGNILTMSPLARISQGFAEANEHFYGSTLLIELIGSAILTPMLEELLYRGVIYERLRFFMGKKWHGIFLSSLIFAMVHLNLVQFIYAFGMGIVLACCMEVTGHVYGAILAHMTANLIAVLRTECGLFPWLGDGSILAWTSSIVLLLIGCVVLKRKLFSMMELLGGEDYASIKK